MNPEVDAYIIVDLGFGDAGKGTVVDWLSRRLPDATVVRHNGGCQAAHNVVTDDGRHHTFAQLGSGTLAGARTHLSKYMLVDPMNMMNELHAITTRCDQWDVLDRLTIDPAVLITTRLHVAFNRLQEMHRGGQRHGSCGQGIGATVQYDLEEPQWAIHGWDLIDDLDHSILAEKLERLGEWVHDQIRTWSVIGTDRALAEYDALRDFDAQRVASDYKVWARMIKWRKDAELTGNLIFEGAQGVMLDETFGTAPYHTWSTTTDRNARAILRELGRDGYAIGVTRTYQTRHGEGPFPTEGFENVRFDVPEAHNSVGVFQGGWRQGNLDLPLLRYAIDCCERIDGLAITHMDCLPADGWAVGTGYVEPSGRHVVHVDPRRMFAYNPIYELWPAERYDSRLADELGLPLVVTSWGPTAGDKMEYAHA